MNDMPNNWQPPPPRIFQATDELTVTLQAQEWDIVAAALNELPMRVARPVFDKIMGQVQRLRQIEANNVSN